MDIDLGGYFKAYNAVSGIGIWAVANACHTLPSPLVYPIVGSPDFGGPLAGKFDGNVHVKCALSAGSVWTPYMSSQFIDVDFINIIVSELSGFSVSGSYFEQLPLNYDYQIDGGLAPHELVHLNGVALSAGSWGAFDGDIISHQDTYVEGCLITNCVSAGHGNPLVINGSAGVTDNFTISGNLYVSGDTAGASNLTIAGSAYVGGDLEVDGLLIEPTATNIFVLSSLYTNSVLPFSGNTITIGCTSQDLGTWDTDTNFGVKVCGSLSANALFGLLNTAYTELDLDDTVCTTAVTGNATLWSSTSSTWDGMLVLYTEATGVSGYSQVEGWTDGIMAAQMIVGNPGNITNSLISHPISAQRTLENKQSFTIPLIAGKPWEVRLNESYGNVCHHVKVYKHIRDVNMTDLNITQNLYVGGNLLVSGVAVFDNDVDIAGDLYISGVSIFDDNVYMTSGLYVSGVTYFGDNIVTDGDLIVSGSIINDGGFTTNGDLYVSGTGTIDGDLYVSGISHFGDDIVTDGDLYVSGISHFGDDIDLECNDLLNVRTIQTNETCTPTISVYNNLQVATTSALIVPVGTTAERAPQVQGAVRYNTTQASFEGFNGSLWAGLGGVTKVDGSGNITGTSRTMIGPVTALALGPPQTNDIWFDTTADLIKYYDGASWTTFGAVYL